MPAPLLGIRVLELAEGIAGPYAGRLLASLGAEVVKVEPPGGDPTRRQPLDDEPQLGTSPLFLHLNAGKRNVSRAAFDLESGLEWADVVIDARVESQVSGTPLDPERLRSRKRAVPVISVTAWGFGAAEPGTIRDELLVQAVAGVMTITGDPDGAPLRFPGWQAQYMAGAYAAAAALGAIRTPGLRHVDLSWLACAATGVEAPFADWLQTGLERGGAGAHPPYLYPSGALPCADGFVVPGTIRIRDWTTQCEIYEREDLIEDSRFRRRGVRAGHVAELWAEIAPWYAAHTRREIFERAIERQWALGMVLTGRDTLSDPHLAERGFLGKVGSAEGDFEAPVAPWRTDGLPVPETRVAEPGADDRGWSDAGVAGDRRERSPIAGLRVLELTVAWAGPFVGRYLGALGADVVKVESPGNYDGWRGPHPLARMIPGHESNALSHDVAAQFNSLNRNKRQVALDLKSAEGRELFLELVAEADVVVTNFTQRVLPSLRLDWAHLRRANPRVILLTMPALGASGPYRNAAGYGSIIEGMGGFGARFGSPEEGARISQTFYPDPVAGIHGVVAVLSALAARDRSGEGAEIDLSQQEVLWMFAGEAIVLASRDGRDVARLGNREPGAATSGVFPAAGGEWVAVVSAVGCDSLLADSQRHDAATLARSIRDAGGRAERVLRFPDAAGDPRMRPGVESIDHPVTGRVSYLRVPVRVDGAAPESSRPAPLFDEHTDEVLADWLGFAPERVAELRARGCVGGAPSSGGDA